MTRIVQTLTIATFAVALVLLFEGRAWAGHPIPAGCWYTCTGGYADPSKCEEAYDCLESCCAAHWGCGFGYPCYVFACEQYGNRECTPLE
jgi:hypothetical protein